MPTEPFDPREFLPFLLNQAAEESSLAFQKVYKQRYGLLRTEWRVLFHLAIYGRMHAGQIAAQAKLHKTKISRAVARLEARRFLSRARDPKDRRLEHLSLTPRGIAAYDDLQKIAAAYERALTAHLTAADVGMLRRTLKSLARTDQKLT